MVLPGGDATLVLIVTMFSTSRWLAHMRYNRRTKRIQQGGFRPYGSSTDCLVRADKNKALEEMINRRKTTDVCWLPFVFPSGAQGHRQFVIYENFYCILPPPLQQEEEEGAAIRAYSAWLNKAKSEHPLPEGMMEKLRKDNKTVEQTDVLTAMHHFFVSNKFTPGGFVLSADEEEPTVTLVYYRTQPIPDGVLVNPYLFSLLDSQSDTHTHTQINNEWCGEIIKMVAAAQRGADTDITHIPLDKTLYATVTSTLKPSFFTQQTHERIE